LSYVWFLWWCDAVHLNAVANIGSHNIASNLLLSSFVHAWVLSRFWLAELLLIFNFFNLSFAYFRHPATPRAIRLATIAGPLHGISLPFIGSVLLRFHRRTS
jgi:hypothetical protein